jgi:hypothetical protein
MDMIPEKLGIQTYSSSKISPHTCLEMDIRAPCALITDQQTVVRTGQEYMEDPAYKGHIQRYI